MDGKQKRKFPLGKLLKEIAFKALPGGDIIKNLTQENGAPPGKYDRARTWPDTAFELGKLVIYVAALHYFGITIF